MRWRWGLRTVIIGSNLLGLWLCTLIHQMHWHPHSNSMWYRVRVRCFSVRCPYHGNSCKILAVRKRWNETHCRYVEKCHFVLSFYPRRQEFEPWMHWLLLLCHRGISDREGSYIRQEESTVRRATLHSTFFWDFLRRTKKVTRYSDAHPNLGLLGPKKITFSANISKTFVPKTARKRKFNGKKCPFSCFPPPMVTQTTQHPARWKAHDKTHQNYIFF